MLNFQGTAIRIQYTGKITSADEIKFTRQVADFATEELVATRVKPKKSDVLRATCHVRHDHVLRATCYVRHVISIQVDMESPTSEPKRLVAPLAALAFVSLGLPDGLLGVAWPSMRVFFGVDLQALGGLLVATTAGYVASSFSSGRLLRQVNLGTVLAASCLLTASGLLGYAAASHWPVVLALGVVLGVGAGAIDAALNTYVATHHGARTLNWLHACFGIGAASGPLMMTAVLQRGSTWQRGYVIVGIAQIALATCFALTFRAWPRGDGLAPSADSERRGNDGGDASRTGRVARDGGVRRICRGRSVNRCMDVHRPHGGAPHQHRPGRAARQFVLGWDYGRAAARRHRRGHRLG